VGRRAVPVLRLPRKACGKEVVGRLSNAALGECKWGEVSSELDCDNVSTAVDEALCGTSHPDQASSPPLQEGERLHSFALIW
jgi:hypothetical protein